MITTQTYAKNEGQRSIGSIFPAIAHKIEWKQADRQTDTTDRISVLANAGGGGTDTAPESGADPGLVQ